ncbi:hypothetical protein [Methylobacterium sp. Leaf118]|uniref:hypothetical protein n=1 Tax=Methylobacterium sp. Leaf118 TaxID=2876562 RepID=UPI001E38792C|nr:hypothetical protein [Methylobacterium sp. Leaf118]
MTGPGATGAASTARLDGLASGQQIARNAVERARTNLALLRALAPSLERAEHAGAHSLSDNGWTAAEIEEWSLGFFEGAEPVVQAFLAEVQAATEFRQAQADAISALTRMEAAAKRIGAHAKPSTPLPGLGSPKLGPLLRPGDFGALPMPPRP